MLPLTPPTVTESPVVRPVVVPVVITIGPALLAAVIEPVTALVHCTCAGDVVEAGDIEVLLVLVLRAPRDLDRDDDRVAGGEDRIAVVHRAPGCQVERSRPEEMVEGLGGDLRDVGVLGVAAEIIPRGRQEGPVLQTLDRG